MSQNQIANQNYSKFFRTNRTKKQKKNQIQKCMMQNYEFTGLFDTLNRRKRYHVEKIFLFKNGVSVDAILFFVHHK